MASEPTPCKCHKVKFAMPDTDKAHSIYRYEINRAFSFIKSVTGEKWQLDVPCADLMAKAGFFFVGGLDIVRCFECFITIGYWNYYVQAPQPLMNIHSKFSKTCRFVLGSSCGNVRTEESSNANSIPSMTRTYDEAIALYANAPRAKVSAASIRFDNVDTVIVGLTLIHVVALPNRRFAYPLYSCKESRLRSFETWPASKTQTKEDMAFAGFFYSGTDDTVICYQCGLRVWGWQPWNNPVRSHKNIFFMCPHIMDVAKELTEIESQEMEIN